MGENNGFRAGQARHSRRGFGLAAGALAIAAAATCSSTLGNPTSTGTAGTGGTPTGDGTAGIAGGDAGAPGTAGTGGISGCPFPYTGASCGSNTCMVGTGNYCGTSTAGIGGTAGSGGTGGTVSTMPYPACPSGAVTFGICFVNDADVLPLPPLSQDPGTRTNGSTVATIENVGTGTAPASCESARFIGAPGPSDWWFQARTGDNRLWTIGVHGLGNTALVKKNDSVTLDLEWSAFQISTYGPPAGHLQLSDAAPTPLLGSWATAGTALLINSGSTWLTLAPSGHRCVPETAASCDAYGTGVVATVNGSMATLPPYGAADVGGYHVVTGALVQPKPTCADYFGPPFDAAAVKIP